MKRTGIACLLVIFFLAASAQHQYEWYNQGDTVCIQANTLVCVQGDVHNIGAAQQAWVNHNGVIEIQGNLYSNNLFQQRGTGVIRLYNRQVNQNERQFIQGSYAVRGGQNKIGIDDGSIFNLELSNSKGVVYLAGNGNVLDVTNSINFKPGDTIVDNNYIRGAGVTNNLVTHNVGLSGTVAYPPNGSNYSAVFGMMNTAEGNDRFLNNSISRNGNESQIDSGYVVGKLRRAIKNDITGTYGFPLGLEPSLSPSAARGIQYMQLNSKPNAYDVVTAYFQQGSSNNVWGNITYCGGTVSNYYGSSHGEWMVTSLGYGSEDFDVTMYPQDFVAAPAFSYFITRNNGFAGNASDCYASPVGLTKSGFYSFGEFGFAGSLYVLPLKTLQFDAYEHGCDVLLKWSHNENEKVALFEIEMAVGNAEFKKAGAQLAYSNRTSYSYLIKGAAANVAVRLKITDALQQIHYSTIKNVQTNCTGQSRLLLYPNPVHDKLTMNFENYPVGNYNCEIFSSAGSRVLNKKISLFNNARELRLMDLQQLVPGIYWIKVFDAAGKSMATEKIIIQRKESL